MLGKMAWIGRQIMREERKGTGEGGEVDRRWDGRRVTEQKLVIRTNPVRSLLKKKRMSDSCIVCLVN